MRYVLLLCLISFAAKAQTLDEDQCRLQYLKGVASSHAVGMINGACNFLSLNSSTMELNKTERQYNECLLKELQGVLNNQAASLVQQACRQRASNAGWR